jgi:hypothetical protein
MKQEEEICCKCDCATGRAGRSDDSIYVMIEGKEVGPLCEECHQLWLDFDDVDS